MTIKIRPATADELPELRRMLVQSLARQMADFTALTPEFTLCAFEDGRAAAVHGSWPLTMRFNGKALPISGVTTVSTDVIDRLRGHLRKLVTRHFEELHEQAMLLVGQITASQAARAGKLSVHEPQALPIWDKTLRTIHQPFSHSHW